MTNFSSEYSGGEAAVAAPTPALGRALSDAESVQAQELGPWVHGPFRLGEDIVLGADAEDDIRWNLLEPQVARLEGRRVLDLDCGAGYMAFMFKARGAASVVACETSSAPRGQAEFLEKLFRSGVTIRAAGWRGLDPVVEGTFDLVYCGDLAAPEPEPLAKLARIRALVAPGGQVFAGARVLADPSLSEFARFTTGATGAPGWLPGRLALRWMLESAGFEVAAELGEQPAPSVDFPVVSTLLRLVPIDPNPATLHLVG